MHQFVGFTGLTAHTEDWFSVMVDNVDVAGAFEKHEELATAELRTAVAHTNSIARELRVTTARVESIAQEGNDMVLISFSELMLGSPTQSAGSPR